MPLFDFIKVILKDGIRYLSKFSTLFAQFHLVPSPKGGKYWVASVEMLSQYASLENLMLKIYIRGYYLMTPAVYGDMAWVKNLRIA